MIIQVRSMIIIALILGIILAAVNHLAKPKVAAQQQAFERQQLIAIVGDKYEIGPKALNKNYQISHTLLSDGLPVGQLEQITTQDGYNGQITYWLGTEAIDNKHQVIGVRIIDHQETPGLGDKLELSVSNWILSFNGLSFSDVNWDVKKYGGHFDQFSGATITPRAVVKSVSARLDSLDQSLDQPLNIEESP